MRVLLDENVPHDLIRKLAKQHDLSGLPFGVVLILAKSNRIPHLLPLTDALREAVTRIGAGRRAVVG